MENGWKKLVKDIKQSIMEREKALRSSLTIATIVVGL